MSEPNKSFFGKSKEKANVSPTKKNRGEFAFVPNGGKAVSRVEPKQNAALSFDSIEQFYIFVNGVVGVLAKWFRPIAKRSNGYLTQRRDGQGNFCK